MKRSPTEETIKIYCSQKCQQEKPCPTDCHLIEGKPGKPLRRIGLYCLECQSRQGLTTPDCKFWNCPLRGFAPQKSRKRIRKELSKQGIGS